MSHIAACCPRTAAAGPSSGDCCPGDRTHFMDRVARDHRCGAAFLWRNAAGELQVNANELRRMAATATIGRREKRC